MPVVLLEKNDTSKFSSSFNVGEHIIGRGPNLLCNSKKVSRNHGVLQLTEKCEVFLRSTHNNPCFYQRSNNANISIVTFGNTIQIHNDDLIALSLDHGWFKVQIRDLTNATDNTKSASSPIDESVLNKTTSSQENLSNKRVHDESNETVNKRKKITELNCEPSTQSDKDNHENVIPQTDIKVEPVEENLEINLDVASSSAIHENSAEVIIKSESADNLPETSNDPPVDDEIHSNKSESAIKEESLPNDSTHNSQTAVQGNDSVDNETDNATTKDVIQSDPESVKDDDSCKKTGGKDNPSTSGTNKRVWRDKCWYGRSCYRKNAAHRAELTHPGDSDYDTDPDDNRPICCYGVDCYRKSREHRRRLRHPGQKKLGAKPKFTRKRRVVKNKAPVPQDSDSDDPYNDYSSDEFVPSEESDTESDYDDDEDYSQKDDRTLMKREAKKFTRKK